MVRLLEERQSPLDILEHTEQLRNALRRYLNCRDPKVGLTKADKALLEQAAPSFDPQTGILLLDDRPVSLEASEQDVLRRLLEKGGRNITGTQKVGL
jgi:DNA-binding response OmpR family regulator